MEYRGITPKLSEDKGCVQKNPNAGIFEVCPLDDCHCLVGIPSGWMMLDDMATKLWRMGWIFRPVGCGPAATDLRRPLGESLDALRQPCEKR